MYPNNSGASNQCGDLALGVGPRKRKNDACILTAGSSITLPGTSEGMTNGQSFTVAFYMRVIGSAGKF